MNYHPFVQKFIELDVDLINGEGFLEWDAVNALCEEHLDPINIHLRKVTIDKTNSAGAEEMYAVWYVCPNCKDDMITKFSKYCPNCGSGIVWK